MTFLRTHCGSWSLLVASAGLLVAGVASAQALSLPVIVPSVGIGSTATDLVYRIDLDTLPARPALIVEVEPDAQHSDMQIEIELTNFLDPLVSIGCPPNVLLTGSWLSDGTPGNALLEADLFFCSPFIDFWNGNAADVRIRVLDFGASGAPATLRARIRAITRVPTELLVQQVSGPQTVRTTADQDTVLYRGDSSASNGAGEFLWSGTRVLSLIPPTTFSFERHALLKFGALDTLVPANAVVTDATLRLAALSILGTPGTVSLYPVADSPTDASWWEGNADAPGDEFVGATGSSSSADWLDRTFSEPWSTPGGDALPGPPLDSLVIGSSGFVFFDDPALVAALQDMVDADDWNDGFVLKGPASNVLSSGVQFASSEYANDVLRPKIEVVFEQPVPFGEGSVDPNLVDFVDEGQDFRWVYDLDDDGIFVTDIGGICEDLLGPFDEFTFPYRYTWAGASGYVGLDCCSWRIESLESGTVGTGQALFFHNLDTSDPANMPPDFDGDGIRDPCDNCIYTPNGPFLGSCMDGTTNNGPCRSDLECTGAGEVCDLSQLDDDGNRIGNACPEPGFASGLLLGVLALATRRARTRTRRTLRG